MTRSPLPLPVPLLIGFGLLAAGTVAALLRGADRAQATEIGVYSGRHYNSDQALYKQFTARTG
ncbi:MAG: hypothetical protein ACO3ZD_12440, partial [Cyanobium sp.]